MLRAWLARLDGARPCGVQPVTVGDTGGPCGRGARGGRRRWGRIAARRLGRGARCRDLRLHRARAAGRARLLLPGPLHEPRRSPCRARGVENRAGASIVGDVPSVPRTSRNARLCTSRKLGRVGRRVSARCTLSVPQVLIGSVGSRGSTTKLRVVGSDSSERTDGPTDGSSFRDRR